MSQPCWEQLQTVCSVNDDRSSMMASHQGRARSTHPCWQNDQGIWPVPPKGWALFEEKEEPGPSVPVQSTRRSAEPAPHSHSHVQSNAADGSSAKAAKLLAALANFAPPPIPMSLRVAVPLLPRKRTPTPGTTAKMYLGLAWAWRAKPAKTFRSPLQSPRQDLATWLWYQRI